MRTEGTNVEKDVNIHPHNACSSERSSSANAGWGERPASATKQYRNTATGSNYHVGVHSKQLHVTSTHSSVNMVSSGEQVQSASAPTANGSKTSSTRPLQQQAQLSQPYRFQTPSYVFNNEQSNHLEQLKGSAGCNCKKSRCLKMYCQCFAASTTCGPKCRCEECYNTAAHGMEIDSARRNILYRNPVAFHKAKILMCQKKQDERQSFYTSLHYNSSYNNYPHPPPLLPPPPPHQAHGPCYASHQTSAMSTNYYPGIPVSNPSRSDRYPPSPPLYHHTYSTFRSAAVPPQKQHFANRLHANHQYVNHHDIRSTKPATISTPCVVEMSPEICSQSSTSLNPVVARTTATHPQIPPPMPPRIQVMQEGCNCRRTQCLKKYCECYQQSIYCCGSCKCLDCKNYPGAPHQSSPDVPIDRNELLDHDHSNIQLPYRPELPTVVREISNDTQIVDAANKATGCHIPMPAKHATHASKSAEVIVKEAREFQPTAPLLFAQSDSAMNKKEDVTLWSTTTRSTDDNTGSPRCVLQGTSKSKCTTSSTADDAMIQAAMAMTELLNGIASTPTKHLNAQESASVECNEETVSARKSAPAVEFHNVVKLKHSEPSMSEACPRPLKQLKMTAPQISKSGSNLMMPIQYGESATVTNRCGHTLLHRQQRPDQRSPSDTCIVQSSSSHKPDKSNLERKPMSHHQRCLPMMSRSHIIPATLSSSSSSSTGSLETDSYMTMEKSDCRPYGNANLSNTLGKGRCNSLEVVTLTSGLPKSLSFRKICSRCGRTRSEHGEMGFGNSCLFESCGRCGAVARCHQRAGQVMGVLCQLSVSDGATPGASATYDRKLRDLATRANFERRNVHHQNHVVTHERNIAL